MKNFFIVGTGRCGTMTIAKTLSQHPKCDCGHHMASVYTLSEMTRYYYNPTDRENRERLIKNLGKVYSLPHRKGVRFGDSDFGLVLVLPLLKELYPKSKFVWLIRDGRDVVSSMFSRGWYAGPEVAIEKGIPTFWETNRIRGDLTKDFTFSEWNDLDRFEKCCWIWSKYNTLIENHFGDIPDRVFHLRFDKMHKRLRRLSLFLHLKQKISFRMERHNSSEFPLQPWEEWTVDWKRKFELQCGSEMTRWFPEWKDSKGTWIRF